MTFAETLYKYAYIGSMILFPGLYPVEWVKMLSKSKNIGFRQKNAWVFMIFANAKFFFWFLDNLLIFYYNKQTSVVYLILTLLFSISTVVTILDQIILLKMDKTKGPVALLGIIFVQTYLPTILSVVLTGMMTFHHVSFYFFLVVLNAFSIFLVHQTCEFVPRKRFRRIKKE